MDPSQAGNDPGKQRADIEVRETPVRRRFTAKYKLRSAADSIAYSAVK